MPDALSLPSRNEPRRAPAEAPPGPRAVPFSLRARGSGLASPEAQLALLDGVDLAASAHAGRLLEGPRLGRLAPPPPRAARDLPGEPREALQHELPALPRRRRSRPHRRDDGPRDGRRLPAGARPHRGPHRRRDGRRPGAEPALPVPRRRGGEEGEARPRPLQPDGPPRSLAPRPPGVARRAGRRDRRVAPPPSEARDRRAARGRDVREVARGDEEAERPRLRLGPERPDADPRDEPGRGVPARRPGLDGEGVEGGARAGSTA